MHRVRISFLGGFISTKQLRLLAAVIDRSASKQAWFTHRQQVIIPKIKLNDIYLQQLGKSAHVSTENELVHNIVSSNNVGGMNNKEDWAYTQDFYIDILNNFSNLPKLSVGLIFPEQSIEPIFSSQVNFLVSETKDYWLLVLQRGKKRVYASFLLKSSVIAKVTSYIEQIWGKSLQDILEKVEIEFENSVYDYENFTINYTKRAILEGFLKNSEFEYVLNIYSYNKFWEAGFLDALAVLLTKYNLGRIYLTSRKSLLIKHIPKESLNEWQILLARYSMSVHHAESDFLWNFDQSNSLLLKFKNRLNSYLARRNKSLHSVFIALQDNKQKHYFYDEHIIVGINKKFFRNKYSISFRESFDYRNSNIQVIENLSFQKLIDKIVNLSQRSIYELIDMEQYVINEKINKENISIYECPCCLSRYDERYGLPEKGIEMGMLFDNLPSSWECFLCGNSKQNFIKVKC